MISLVYFSSAAPDAVAHELDTILAVSRRNNTPAGVTGLLCHLDGSYLQFLEGEETAVATTFARIAGDPRHRDLLEVHRAPIVARAFPDWSMGLVKSGDLDPAHTAFCRNLRAIEIAAEAEHQAVLRGFLYTFRSWLR